MDNRIIPKAWITQYALTQGVFIVENAAQSVRNPATILVKHFTFYDKPHWHETEEEAHYRVEELLRKKLRSLNKQFDRLKDLDPYTMVQTAPVR